MVKRLRHRPFTAVTGVRFPLGSIKEIGFPISFLGGIERVRVRKQSGGLFSRTLTEPAGETDSPSGQSGAVALTSEMEKMRQPFLHLKPGSGFYILSDKTLSLRGRRPETPDVAISPNRVTQAENW